MKKNYFLTLAFLFIFSIGHSQTTLYTNDITSTSIVGTSLNDLGYSDHNTLSWTTSSLYFFDHTVDGDCDTTTDWTEASTQNSYYGTAPAGMSSYRAGIKSASSSCS